MRVRCSKVIPSPLAESRKSGSGIWGGEFCTNAREAVLVVSPSGQGKTTLLHLLYGIRRDYSGVIALDANDIRSLSQDAWLKLRQRHISIAFQELRLFDNITARQNIELVRTITGEISASRMEEMAEEVEIADLLDMPCGRLSSGQRQRVALIRALARPFSLLLLDEPFSHLDAESSKKAAGVICRRRQENSATVLITGLADECPLQVDRICPL